MAEKLTSKDVSEIAQRLTDAFHALDATKDGLVLRKSPSDRNYLAVAEREGWVIASDLTEVIERIMARHAEHVTAEPAPEVANARKVITKWLARTEDARPVSDHANDLLANLDRAGLTIVTAEPATPPSVEQVTLPSVARALEEAGYGPEDGPAHMRIAALAEDRDRLESNLAALLCDLTDGRMSKTNYDVRTMVQQVEAAFERHAEEEAADLRAKVERYKAALGAAEEYIGALTAAYEAEAEARYASQSASAADDHQRHKYDAYSAARAAVEAETSEEAGA